MQGHRLAEGGTRRLALTGLILLARTRRFALAAVLGVGVAVPIFLALGTTTPLYSALWHALPPFRFPRVPERLLPIANRNWSSLTALTPARPWSLRDSG